MTSLHRKRVIEEIKNELKQLEIDYPNLKNVPQDRRITVISTSLIEAGVDLDFYCVYRELTRLDSILQAGGRCNREGKRDNAKTFVFSREEQVVSNNIQEEFTKGIINKYSDISCFESISEFYKNFYDYIKDTITNNAISCQCNRLDTIPFSSYAEQFNLIDSNTISLVVPQDEECRTLCKLIEIGKPVSQRKLQKYTCSVYPYELENLKKQGVVNDYDSGIWCLTNSDYYDNNTGVIFEASDYII
jgi:CRISPR-associated endonuclease/helicase Cas3